MPSRVWPRLTVTPTGRHVGEADGVVGLGEDGLGQVVADFARVDVEGGDELDVADVVAAEVDVHQAGHELVGRSVAVLVDALDEGGSAVADADDGDAYRFHTDQSTTVSAFQ